MPFVGVTRLRIRSARFLPGFAWHNWVTLRQLKTAAGFLGGSLSPDRGWTFWTMTVWDDEAAMRRYVSSGRHLKAMPHLLHWCDEAAIVHWAQDSTEVPPWPDAHRRMFADGRASKLYHPSARQMEMKYDAPRLGRAAAIHPAAPTRAGKRTWRRRQAPG